MKRVNVLDHGFVELVDFMGSDRRILQAARVSTGGPETRGDEKDKNLIEYLYVNKHLTPFEMAVFTFHIKLPIAIARQWIRHRSQSYNEYSLRYSEAIDEMFVPDVFRRQNLTNKQMSGDCFNHNDSEKLKTRYLDTIEHSFDTYKSLLEDGVSRELARGVLPVSQYTEMYITLNLRNLFHFLELRLHPHAQTEIRKYATAILEILQKLEEFKWSVNIFENVVMVEQAFLEKINEARKFHNGFKSFENHILNF